MSKRKVHLCASALLLALLCDDSDEEEDAKPTKRSCWVDELHLTREREGLYAKLNNMRSNPAKFKNFVRMSSALFDALVERVTPFIGKKDTNFRKAIAPAERVAVTVRYLASGSSMVSLSYSFRMSKAVISSIIPATCSAIVEVLKDEYMKVSIKLIYYMSEQN